MEPEEAVVGGSAPQSPAMHQVPLGMPGDCGAPGALAGSASGSGLGSAPHPLGLASPPSGQLEVPPGAYVHLGPALPSNALGSAQWLPDDAAKNCMRCGEEFTAFTRRHHCRQCGQLFCHRCCNSKALLQPGSGTSPEDRVAAHPVFGAGETDKRKPQKVCGKCFELLLPMQPYLTATNSKAMLQPDFSEVATMLDTL